MGGRGDFCHSLLWSFKMQSQSSGGVIQEYLTCGIYSLLSSHSLSNFLHGSLLPAMAALTFSMLPGSHTLPLGDPECSSQCHRSGVGCTHRAEGFVGWSRGTSPPAWGTRCLWESEGQGSRCCAGWRWSLPVQSCIPTRGGLSGLCPQQLPTLSLPTSSVQTLHALKALILIH